MVIDLDETWLRTIEQLEEFLGATPEVVFAAPGAGRAAENQRYEHISHVLTRFDYPRRNKHERGVVLAYLRRTSAMAARRLASERRGQGSVSLEQRMPRHTVFCPARNQAIDRARRSVPGSTHLGGQRRTAADRGPPALQAVWRATQAIRNDAARPRPASPMFKLLTNEPLERMALTLEFCASAARVSS